MFSKPLNKKGNSDIETIIPHSEFDPIIDAFRESLFGIVLFGSAARGDDMESSDIDLLIIVNLPLNRKLYSKWDQELNSIVSEKFSPHFVNIPQDPHQSGSIWLEAAMEGVICYDPNGLVSTFLKELRGLIAGGVFERKWSHGHPYWARSVKHAK